jgi:heat-inducible transcriptional repressor
MVPHAQRLGAVLQSTVLAFWEHGHPVSSQQVTPRLGKRLACSPATVRKLLVELTDAGLLRQVRVNGGRVPTEHGIRQCLDAGIPQRLLPWDKLRLCAAKTPQAMGEALSAASGHMAVVGVPQYPGRTVREISLVAASPRRVVSVVALGNGQRLERVVDLDQPILPADLTRIENYLNQHLTHRTFGELCAHVREELASTGYHKLRGQALAIGLRVLPEPDFDVHVAGRERLLAAFGDLGRLQSVLAGVYSHDALLKLLEKVLGGGTPSVLLGSEHQVPELHGVACVGGSTSTVALSVIGPDTMNYSRLLPLLHHASHWMSEVWR